MSLCGAGPTRLELATSGLTGRRSNQLNYDPKFSISGLKGQRSPPTLCYGGQVINNYFPLTWLLLETIHPS